MKARFILSLAMAAGGLAQEPVFLEAESFVDHGGWVIDTAFLPVMGSPYLLAHGLGVPVADAVTTAEIPAAGRYRVWARTKDWVAPWQARGEPGRFRVGIGDRMLPVEFGTRGADWHWHFGGEIDLPAGPAKIVLRDLTGFCGRCDAILLSADARFVPPEGADLEPARRQWLGRGREPDLAGTFDLVVCGGGYAGMGAALAAARQGLSVALIQDRFVLGGNGSSEIRVWAQGGTMRGKFPHLGEIVEEFADHAPDSPAAADQFGDQLKEAVCRREKNLTLFLGHFIREVQTDRASGAITSITALDVRSGHERSFRGRYFSDCTGHGTIGALAGARHHVEPAGRMGMSNMWYWQFEDGDHPWPQTPWALALEIGDFPPQVASRSRPDGKPFMKGEWFWESGFDKDPLKDLELIRDWNLRAVFGAFSALKHGAESRKYASAALKWVSHVGGPRESRLLEGDVILTREDIISGREFPDGTVPTTWDIDLHYPKEQYAKKYPDNPFISRAEFGAGVDRANGYPVPYRCFYSVNVPNLFMAGRCISVTHEALGTVRVMRTCGMMGEVVGRAAYLCVRNKVPPRAVYQNYLPDLLGLLGQPGSMRRDAIDSPLYHDPAVAGVRPYLNKGSDSVTGVPAAESGAAPAPPGNHAGIVVDETAAALVGPWSSGGRLRPCVGEGYRYAAAGSEATARYEFSVPRAGSYEVRLAWVPHENRSTRTACRLERHGQPPLTLRLDQRAPAKDSELWHSIGRFDLPAGERCAIVLSAKGADGFVHADAIQVLGAP